MNALTHVTITYTYNCGIYVVIVSEKNNKPPRPDACHASLSRSFPETSDSLDSGAGKHWIAGVIRDTREGSF